VISIFAVPKPFIGHVGIIQRNAVRSWSRLHPNAEVILCGDEPGTKEMAAEVHATYLPQVARNEYGTPLLDSVFEHAQRTARSRLMCYVNADIVLMSDFATAIQRIAFDKFLMVGQRWDVDVTDPWDFEQRDWEAAMRSAVAARGRLHPPMGSDYFVFPRHLDAATLPPFAVGRPAWDNWFIYHARRHRVPVIDATRVTTVVHQNHDYGHVPERRDDAWEGPEADWNRSVVEHPERSYVLSDASHVLTPKWVMPTVGLRLKRLVRVGLYQCRRSASLSVRAYRRLREKVS
jgi:hypothetical protein